MADFVQILKDDLEKGYSKSDLELIIGLPKNSLSGVIKGDKKLSRKSELKIEIWNNSEKPSPLKIAEAKVQMALAKVRTLQRGASGQKIDIQDLGKPEIKYADTTVTSFDGEKVDHKNTDEAGQWEEPKDATIYPKDFQGLLTMAKGEIKNVEAFKMAVAASKCNANQKSMILSKVK